MEETKQIPSRIKITAAFALVILTILLPVNIHGTAQVTISAVENDNESGINATLPTNLLAALSQAHGNYESLINQEDMLRDLQAVDIVLIGEAHYDQRDMQTAFEITRLLAQRRAIALAVERFPLTLQSRLVDLNTIDSDELREEEMRSILQTDEYKTVWKTNSFNSPYPNTPSTDEFEAMMLWAGQKRIQIIALDLPLSERASGLGEDIPYRNEIWKNQIVNYLDKNQSENYLIVAIGGIDHLSNAPDSVQAKIRKNPSNYQILSIGQRDANYSAKIPLRVKDLALTYRINDLIVRIPQFAVALQNGIAIFPTPPDYWIAVHSVDSWEK
jgi:hypothetical protein